MSRAIAFETVPCLVQYTDDEVTDGVFDISASQHEPAAVEGFYGVRGYAELAQIGVPVARTKTGVERVKFHIFGVTEGAPFIDYATPNVMDGARAWIPLPAGSLAVIDSVSLSELAGRAGMTSKRLTAHLAALAEAEAEGAIVSNITTAHAVVGIGPRSVVVGRGEEAMFSSLLDREDNSMASRSHFTVALGGLFQAAALRIHALNRTSVTYMR